MDIPIVERFSINDLIFKATEKISLGIYKVECETAGIIGNGVTGNLIPINYIQNLAKAEITELLIPGEDEEDDETLRARAFAGNVIDYKNKTKEINGVGAVKVTPIWNRTRNSKTYNIK